MNNIGRRNEKKFRKTISNFFVSKKLVWMKINKIHLYVKCIAKDKNQRRSRDFKHVTDTFVYRLSFIIHYTLFFYKTQLNSTLDLLFLKFVMIFEVYSSWFILIFSWFLLIFHNAVMIYNTRNRNNDTTENQKEKKVCFNAYAGGKLTVQIWKIYTLGIRCGHLKA